MLTAYFDESRTDHGHRYPVVAGFLGDADTWLAFDKRWHVLADSNPNKSRQKKANRKNIDLAKLAVNCSLLCVDVSVDTSVWDFMIKAFRQRNRPTLGPDYGQMWSSAYGMCSHMCCQMLDAWAGKMARLRPESKIKVVFDDGNPDKRSFYLGYKAYKKAHPGGFLADVPIFDSDDEIPALKAADIYAGAISTFLNTGTKGGIYLAIEEAQRTDHALVMSYVLSKEDYEIGAKLYWKQHEETK